MNKKDYDKARNAVLATIAGESPDPRPTISLAARAGMAGVAAVSMVVSAFLAPASIFSIPLAAYLQGAAVLAGVAAIPVGLIGVSGLGNHLGSSRPKGPGIVTLSSRAITTTIAAALGRAIPVDQEGADWLRGHARAYPEVQQAIDRWREQRSNKTLSIAEFRFVDNVCDELVDLRKNHYPPDNDPVFVAERAAFAERVRLRAEQVEAARLKVIADAEALMSPNDLAATRQARAMEEMVPAVDSRKGPRLSDSSPEPIIRPARPRGWY